MERLKTRLLRPLKKDNKGAAMILVLCVMILFFVLALTIMFSSSVLVGQAKNDRISRQCMLLATSFSKKVDDMMAVQEAQISDTLDLSKMKDFVRAHIDSRIELEDIENGVDAYEGKWQFYWNPGTDSAPVTGGTSNMSDAIHSYAVNIDPEGDDTLSKNGYSMYMEIYWTMDDYEAFKDGLSKPKEMYNDILLVVNVICENAGSSQSYKVQSIYQLSSINPDAIPDGAEAEDVKWQDFIWNWQKQWRDE